MKEIIIDDKKYKIDCNAFTYIKYPTFFKNGIIDDMNSVRNYIKTKEKRMTKQLHL